MNKIHLSLITFHQTIFMFTNLHWVLVVSFFLCVELDSTLKSFIINTKVKKKLYFLKEGKTLNWIETGYCDANFGLLLNEPNLKLEVLSLSLHVFLKFLSIFDLKLRNILI